MPFAVGDRAVLVAEPAVQAAIYHQRFHGKSGFIVGKQGDCYKLEIKDGGKTKIVIVHPIHLKKLAATLTQKQAKVAKAEKPAAKSKAAARPKVDASKVVAKVEA